LAISRRNSSEPCSKPLEAGRIFGKKWQPLCCDGKSIRQMQLMALHAIAAEQFLDRDIVSTPRSRDQERTSMKHIALVGIIIACALAMPGSASARLAAAPVGTLAAQDDAVIQVKGGHGHGRGHMGRGGRGHHYGWSRGRGHHYGHRHH
jgi:hypothetical protein